MMLRLIVIGVLFYLLFRILRFLFSPPPSRRSRVYSEGKKELVNEMVQDPHCGVYVARKEAYSIRVGNDLLYFCSEECCQKYLQRNKNP